VFVVSLYEELFVWDKQWSLFYGLQHCHDFISFSTIVAVV
jgi:hypothetical protein